MNQIEGRGGHRGWCSGDRCAINLNKLGKEFVLRAAVEQQTEVNCGELSQSQSRSLCISILTCDWSVVGCVNKGELHLGGAVKRHAVAVIINELNRWGWGHSLAQLNLAW